MFSVVIASYNSAKYLPESIGSILNQNCGDFELLVVDDGSADNSVEVAEAYAARDRRVRVIAKPHNTGISDTLNIGIEYARRDWIAILDSDDVATPIRLEKQAEAIYQQPDVIAWAGYSHYVNQQRRLLYVSMLGPETEDEFHELRQKHEPIMFGHYTFTFRRDVGRKIGGYDSLFKGAPDLDLMDRMSDHGMMLTIPEQLAYRRIRDDSTTFTKFFRQEDEIRYLYERRRAQNEGRTLTWEQFEANNAEKSALTKLRARLQGYGRYYWYHAGLAMGQRKIAPLVKNLSLSLACTPFWTSKRILGQLRQRAESRG